MYKTPLNVLNPLFQEDFPERYFWVGIHTALLQTPGWSLGGWLLLVPPGACWAQEATEGQDAGEGAAGCVCQITTFSSQSFWWSWWDQGVLVLVFGDLWEVLMLQEIWGHTALISLDFKWYVYPRICHAQSCCRSCVFPLAAGDVSATSPIRQGLLV